MAWSRDPVVVRSPATSANLGPGFDALGLALTLHDEVEARVTDEGLSIEVSGEGELADLAGAGEEHLVVRSMRAAFGLLGAQPPGLALRCLNQIPHGRGLGSSAAAIVAGILAARALAGDASQPCQADLALATEFEGHPDNVAACLFGGLTIAWTHEGQPRALRLEPEPGIVPVALIAPEPVSTEEARKLLPATVPHPDAVQNATRSALLIAALTTSAAEAREALLAATEDRLHQEYRAPFMPATHDLVRRLRAARIPAVVSGAGPTVLAFLPGDSAGRDALGRLDSIAAETGSAWRISPLDVERHGASIRPPLPGRQANEHR